MLFLRLEAAGNPPRTSTNESGQITGQREYYDQDKFEHAQGIVPEILGDQSLAEYALEHARHLANRESSAKR